MSDFEEGLIVGQLQLIESVQNILNEDVTGTVEQLNIFLAELKSNYQARQEENKSKGDSNE